MAVFTSIPRQPLFAVQRIVLIAAAFVVLASPTWLQQGSGRFSAFPIVSIAYLAVVIAMVAVWGRTSAPAPGRLNAAAVAAGGAALLLIGLATLRFVDTVLLNPSNGDMLAVIEQAGRRFLRGRDPYGTYQVPWNVSLGYGPPLWAPFLVPQLLGVDLRLLTVSGQLFVPICCGSVAVLDAARGRPLAAVAWILLLAAIVFDPDLLRFVSAGHTPVYWPLLPIFAILTVGRHWRTAAVVLGVLVAGRATMIVVVPVFLMAIWFRDRSRMLVSGLICSGVVAAILLPFFIWDPAAMWLAMISNYGRVVKEVVWHSSDEGAIRTIGLTGWLLSHGLERFVELSQACAVAIVYVIAWRGVGRGASALPYMGLALFAFSMTTLWPVYYFHFDVVLLLASAALAESVGTLSLRRALTAWPLALACAIGLVGAAVRIRASPHPSIVIDQAEGRRLLRQGFVSVEDDGARRFSWIEGSHAVVLVPRSSASDAEVVVTAQPFVPAGAAPQAVTMVLNGVLLGTQQAGGGWQMLRFRAPAAAWRIGANELELQFPPIASPKELGLSDDPRRLAMAVERIDVQPR